MPQIGSHLWLGPDIKALRVKLGRRGKRLGEVRLTIK